MHRSGEMVDAFPANADGQIPSFPSTPARQRDSSPVMGPPSVGPADKTPYRGINARGSPDVSIPSRPWSNVGAQGNHNMAYPMVRRRWSMSHALMQRECRSARIAVPRTLLQDFVSTANNTYYIGENSFVDGGSPPFSLRWGTTKREGTLAVADEEGHITLINTRMRSTDSSSCTYSWACHRNAIFDIALADGDDLIATASGDQTIRVWDLSKTHPELKATLRGHGGSVKSVQFRPGCQTELVSAAREGSIHFWDLRVPEGSTSGIQSMQTISPAHQIQNAHVRDDVRGGLGTKGNKKSAGSQHSVTSVVFIDDTVVATAGANDGVVKLWDLRKSFSIKHSGRGGAGKVESFMSREASATGRARGISSLSVNASRTKLLASSADHHIYIFDCVVPELEPTIYSGHVHNSFYVKSSFSPDGRYIVSGSSDECVYIWDVSTPLLPPIRLRGHRGEVSDVRWCPTDMCKLASSSDDTTVRVWSIDRERRERMREGLPVDGGDSEKTRSGWVSSDSSSEGGASIGEAEVPESWSQPSLRSEDDLLSCYETMLVSNTTNTPQTALRHAATPQTVPRHAAMSAATPGSAQSAMARGPAASPPQWFNSSPDGGASDAAEGARGHGPSPPGYIATSPGPNVQLHEGGEGGGSLSPSLKQAKLDEIWKPRSASPPSGGQTAVEQMTAGLKQTRIHEMFRPTALAARLILECGGVQAAASAGGGDEPMGGSGVRGEGGSRLGQRYGSSGESDAAGVCVGNKRKADGLDEQGDSCD